MQEFLEPTEKRITLPTVQTDEAQETANCDAHIAEIEDVCKLAKRVRARAIGATFGAMTALFFILTWMPGDGLIWYIITHWKSSLGGWYYPLLKFTAVLPTMVGGLLFFRVRRNRRLREQMEAVVAKVSANSNPLLIPSLLNLVQSVRIVQPKTSQHLIPTINSLLLHMDARHVAHFQKSHVDILGFYGWGLYSPFATLNALKYIGNEGSARTLRRILSKPPPAHDAYQVLFHQTIEAAIPVIEARLAREDTHQNLLRPSQLIDESTLLRPSQEREEPAEELLRPVQGEE